MSSTYAVKGKAKQFLGRLFDSDKNTKPTPPTPVAMATSSNSNPNSSNNLVQSFDALALSGQSSSNANQHNTSPGFIGGFNPGYIPPIDSYVHDPKPQPSLPFPGPLPHSNSSPNTNGTSPLLYPHQSHPASSPSANPLPRPPAMPIPHSQPAITQNQSLTMQHALCPPTSDQFLSSPHTPPSRPHSASVLPPPKFNFSPAPSPSPSAAASLSLHPSPAKPKRQRASSTPPTPTTTSSGPGDTTQMQCAGVTKAGKRCTRQVKSGPALSGVISSDADAPIERFCFQHSKEVLGPSGYYARKNGVWVKFEDWIPDYLQPDTQVALRVEMEKARSQSDVPGYIYTFEIRDTKSPKTIKLKVGRAVNLVKRIDQWGKQCESKEQVLRGWYPGTVEDDDTSAGSLMKGRVKAGEKGPWCHRLERLIHLELADLCIGAVYLDGGWPKVGAKVPLAGNGPPTPKKGSGNGKDKDKPCPDCGATHKEIFEFTRVERGRYKGKEWESIVKPVIEKWGAFVEAYV